MFSVTIQVVNKPFTICSQSVSPVNHLGFLKVGNFNCPYSMEGQNAMPNFVQIGRTVERYGRFSIFQDGGRPPSWIYQKWPTQREPNLAASRNWYLMVISHFGPKMVLVEQFEQSRCFRRLSPLTIWRLSICLSVPSAY